jgi:hypothetical protein
MDANHDPTPASHDPAGHDHPPVPGGADDANSPSVPPYSEGTDFEDAGRDPPSVMDTDHVPDHPTSNLPSNIEVPPELTGPETQGSQVIKIPAMYTIIGHTFVAE